MAKKKAVADMNKYIIDISNLSLSDEKYKDQIKRFVEEQIPQSQVAEDGSTLVIATPKTVNKRVVKMRTSKALYTIGLQSEYRLVTIPKGSSNGYQIVKR